MYRFISVLWKERQGGFVYCSLFCRRKKAAFQSVESEMASYEASRYSPANRGQVIHFQCEENYYPA